MFRTAIARKGGYADTRSQLEEDGFQVIEVIVKGGAITVTGVKENE